MMTQNSENSQSSEQDVVSLFGLYKAEWLNGQLFELFAEPEYFGQLQTKRPVVLVGGRGTGKTTVLRGLSYCGQLARAGDDAATINSWNYYGLYLRVDTNRVAALKGPELTEHQWIKCFAHYFNLVLCDLLIEFVVWYRLQTSKPLDLPLEKLKHLSTSLNINSCDSFDAFRSAVHDARLRFEASINNVADELPAGLSMQGVPVNELASALVDLAPLQGKQFFFLLDEYENFENYQQQVVNTLIKHAPESYTFKVGVRELGWRERGTVRESERLTHPADYALINIHESFDSDRFSKFAASVCNGRLTRKNVANDRIIRDVELAFPGLSERAEAELLGVHTISQLVKEELEGLLNPEELLFLKALDPTQVYLIKYWSEAGNGSVVDLFRDQIINPRAWENRYNNYLYSALFTIRRKKRGIRKYYCGWNVLAKLADGNIRFLLELVHTSYLKHLNENHDLSAPVSPESQTLASQEVGRKMLAELEGISVEGSRLTKMLLSLGRVFQVLAESPEGHTPEVNQFYIGEANEFATDKDMIDVENLLRLAVMHQALVRSPGNKLLDEMDTREYDYRIHPIFSSFFGFSYRHKRKLLLTGAQLLGLVSRPRETIGEVLKKNHRTTDEELPDQLRLFQGYYHGRR